MIAVASVGEGLEGDVMVELRRVLAPVSDAEILAMPEIPLPPSAWDRGRRQYHSKPILRQLASVKPHWAERLVGMADVDLFVPSLNFVFGEADADRRVALFSLTRLRPRGSDRRRVAEDSSWRSEADPWQASKSGTFEITTRSAQGRSLIASN